jgi:hypothetical protein
MYGADGGKERFGRALRIGALGVSLLALVAVVGPRLASSGGGGAPASGSLPAGEPAEVTATTVPPEDRPATTLPATTSSTTSATVTTTTTSAATTTANATTTTATLASPTTPTPMPAVLLPDQGVVDLELIGLHAEAYGPPQAGFFAGDGIGWHFRVTNRGDEYLWGVFVYLELYGPVACTARRLPVGESADCWAETTALVGANEAEAWVTAWTALRMVTDRVSHRLVVPAA